MLAYVTKDKVYREILQDCYLCCICSTDWTGKQNFPPFDELATSVGSCPYDWSFLLSEKTKNGLWTQQKSSITFPFKIIYVHCVLPIEQG